MPPPGTEALAGAWGFLPGPVLFRRLLRQAPIPTHEVEKCNDERLVLNFAKKEVESLCQSKDFG